MNSSLKSEDKCPVCDYKLDASAKSVRVNGRTVKVCCDECDKKIRAEPAKYLCK